MSLASALSFYLNLNLLILIGLIFLVPITSVVARTRFRFSAVEELRLHKLTVLLVLTFAIAQPFFPSNAVFQPAAKVWSAQSMRSFGAEYKTSDRAGYLSLPSLTGSPTVPMDTFTFVWIAIAISTLLFGGFYLLRDLKRILAIKRRSYLARKIGRVRVFVSDQALVPFSFWLPGESSVVIPSTILSRPLDMKMAVSHELQHHRSGDTRWVYLQWGLRLLCVLNPAVYFWNRWIHEIQEFACDEALIGRKRFKSQAYARCLVEVAQTAIDRSRAPVCATGLTFTNESNLLTRRIERMFSTSSDTYQRKCQKPVALAVGLSLALLMGITAYASKGLVQDRRVSLAQAKSMASRLQSEAGGSVAGIPVVVNDLVLKQLNRFIGTPEGREYMRNALARMANHKSMIEEALEKYQVPIEILALPIIESGYQNFAQGAVSQTNQSAGIWQFIPQTARNFGLRVDSQKDERLDTLMLTDAAMRYLQANNLRFKDWQLALMAYNMGENNVQKAMVDLDTRDAWTLIRNGREGDKDYLAKFMAAVLIMRNPDSVQ